MPARLTGQHSSPGLGDSFPGIYTLALPEQPFLCDRMLLLTTQWRSLKRVVAIDLDSGRIQAGCSTHSQAVLACATGETWGMCACPAAMAG